MTKMQLAMLDIRERNRVDDLMKNGACFVFGSNKAGIHGAGAALQAVQYGAIRGAGFGFHGQSFAIPTKDHNLQTLPLTEIQKYVDAFLDFASQQDITFAVTRIGCGLAGYTDEQIAPLFEGATENVKLPEGWTK